MTNEILFLTIVIFFARLIDVTLKTIRTILLVEGRKYLAALFGFVEVSLWFLVIRTAIYTQAGSIYVAIAYGLGFGLGHIVGISLVERFIKQIYKVIIITSSTNDQLVKALRNKMFAVTKIEATGINESKKYYLYLEMLASRKTILDQVLAQYDKNAFVIINKSKDAINGHFYQG